MWGVVPLEHGKDPWRQNAFYFEVVAASTRIAAQNRQVERWVAYFRKKQDDLVQGDTWTNGHAPRSAASSTS